MRTADFELLKRMIAERGREHRCLTAIAGAPGAGKSTLAEGLVAALQADEPDSAAILAMDGFHYDDAVLEARGERARKGAPHTFDVGGLKAMLARLRANDEAAVAVPIFDRSIEIARAGAAIIGRPVRHVIVEGNYLLLDEAPWRDLHRFFDLTVMVEVPELLLRRRLELRWRHLPLDERLLKLECNDLPNGRLVTERSIGADVVFHGDAETDRSS